jgi:hypothetical protein
MFQTRDPSGSFITEQKISYRYRYWLLTPFKGRTPDVILACICFLRKNFPSVRVSVEIEKPGRAGLQELAKAANVVFYSKSWATVR